MKKFNWIILLNAIAVASFGLPSVAQTEVEEELIDLKTMTCREMLKSQGEDRSNITIFMHGYMSGKQEQTAVSPRVLSRATTQILDTCIENPDRTLISVFEENRK